MVYLSGVALPRLSWKKAIKRNGCSSSGGGGGGMWTYLTVTSSLQAKPSVLLLELIDYNALRHN